MIKNWIVNWKTTSTGLLSIMLSVVHLVTTVKAGTANENTWAASLTGILTGVGLLVAGDAAQSSKQTQVLQDKVKEAVETGNTDVLNKPVKDETK